MSTTSNLPSLLHQKSQLYSKLGLFSTSQFFADKALSLSPTPTYYINLAQLYISQNHYRRAYHLLCKNSLHETNPTAKLLAAQCLLYLNQLEDCLNLLGEESEEENLIQTSLSGLTIETPKQISSEVQAALCIMRAKVHHRLENPNRAAFWYKTALTCDNYCIDAFIGLTECGLITKDQTQTFIAQLTIDNNLQHSQQQHQQQQQKELNNWLKQYYRATTDKNVDPPYTNHINNDILRIQAQRYYDTLDFESCLNICQQILKNDPYANESTQIIHLACLLELDHKQDLFLQAHRLVEHDSKSGLSWLAVGYYYLSCGKAEVARNFLQKATQLQPTLISAWVAMGHSFGLQDESDQAMAAYRTAYRLFPGARLPILFMGMEHVRQSSLSQATILLEQALHACPSDPAPRHELGVVSYRRGELSRAANYFKEALCLWRETDSTKRITVATGKRAQAEEATLQNLGHCYRRLKQYQKAKWCYERALGLNARSHVTCTAFGITLHCMGDLHGAIAMYHRALRNHPQHPFCNELLEKALKDLLVEGMDIGNGISTVPIEKQMITEQSY